MVGAAVLVWAATHKRLATEGMALLAIAGMAGGIAGAKLTELIFEGWPLKVPFVAGLDPRAGGRALLGGLIFGWVAVEIAKRRLGIRRSTGDLFALALPAGEAVGRIGCFFNTCCYGTVCNAPWAVYQHGAWRHPTQLYSAVTAAMIFLILLALWRGRVFGIRVSKYWGVGVLLRVGQVGPVGSTQGPLFGPTRPTGPTGPVPEPSNPAPSTQHPLREGDLFKVYLILFGATRFGLEFLRQNDTTWLGLTPMQWFCLQLVAFGTITLAVRKTAATAQ